MRILIAAIVLHLASVSAFAEISGDAENGRQLYKACRACHLIGEGAANRAGPHLNGILGRAAGSVTGFKYTKELSNSGLVWDADMLDRFIEDPQGVLPGNRMAYRGMADDIERADLIAYMSGFDVAIEVEPVEMSQEAQTILELEGDLAYGQYLSSECTSCHAEGKSGIPPIEGLPPEVFVPALVSYRDGTRSHQVMEMLAGRLGDNEIAALSKYYSQIDTN